MNQTISSLKSQRLVSLDAFRGITIAGMILVNNPGTWKDIFGPLRHADWNGLTPTDLVFPFFVFIVGVAVAFAFQRRIGAGSSRASLLAQVVRRTIILFLLGLIMAGFPDMRLIGPYVLVIVGLWLLYADKPIGGIGGVGGVWTQKAVAVVLLAGAVAYFALDFAHFQESKVRVPGVLQRIAVCYFVAALIVMTCGLRGRIIAALLCIVGYWVIALHVPPPAGFDAKVGGYPGLLHEWIDVKLLGAHLYNQRPDPEGLLSTLPAIATTLLGVLTGQWLQSTREGNARVAGLFFAANLALVLGLCMNYGFPINKKIWSSSYVVFTAGLAVHFLAMCYWLIDVKGRRRWAWPFVVFGTNAIAVYVASSLTAKTMGLVKVAAADGQTTTLKNWIYEQVFAIQAEPALGALLFALAYVVFWFLPLIPLHRRRIFIRV